MSARPLLAIFVGGKSRRMGTDKGLLRTPHADASILEWLTEQADRVGLTPILVGDATPYEQLALGVVRVADEPAGAGPLGGLNAALRHALDAGHEQVVAVACDMPHLSVEALEQVCEYRSDAVVVAPRRDAQAPWEPMLARYSAARLIEPLRTALARGERSFQKLFETIEVAALPLTPEVERAIEDWDTPQDITG